MDTNELSARSSARQQEAYRKAIASQKPQDNIRIGDRVSTTGQYEVWHQDGGVDSSGVKIFNTDAAPGTFVRATRAVGQPITALDYRSLPSAQPQPPAAADPERLPNVDLVWGARYADPEQFGGQRRLWFHTFNLQSNVVSGEVDATTRLPLSLADPPEQAFVEREFQGFFLTFDQPFSLHISNMGQEPLAGVAYDYVNWNEYARVLDSNLGPTVPPSPPYWSWDYTFYDVDYDAFPGPPDARVPFSIATLTLDTATIHNPVTVDELLGPVQAVIGYSSTGTFFTISPSNYNRNSGYGLAQWRGAGFWSSSPDYFYPYAFLSRTIPTHDPVYFSGPPSAPVTNTSRKVIESFYGNLEVLATHEDDGFNVVASDPELKNFYVYQSDYGELASNDITVQFNFSGTPQIITPSNTPPTSSCYLIGTDVRIYEGPYSNKVEYRWDTYILPGVSWPDNTSYRMVADGETHRAAYQSSFKAAGPTPTCQPPYRLGVYTTNPDATERTRQRYPVRVNLDLSLAIVCEEQRFFGYDASIRGGRQFQQDYLLYSQAEETYIPINSNTVLRVDLSDLFFVHRDAEDFYLSADQSYTYTHLDGGADLGYYERFDDPIWTELIGQQVEIHVANNARTSTRIHRATVDAFTTITYDDDLGLETLSITVDEVIEIDGLSPLVTTSSSPRIGAIQSLNNSIKAINFSRDVDFIGDQIFCPFLTFTATEGDPCNLAIASYTLELESGVYQVLPGDLQIVSIPDPRPAMRAVDLERGESPGFFPENLRLSYHPEQRT